ncbi:MAG: hypothetical protein ACRDL7_13535, partial [Gaiellaceae bacterium]
MNSASQPQPFSYSSNTPSVASSGSILTIPHDYYTQSNITGQQQLHGSGEDQQLEDQSSRQSLTICKLCFGAVVLLVVLAIFHVSIVMGVLMLHQGTAKKSLDAVADSSKVGRSGNAISSNGSGNVNLDVTNLPKGTSPFSPFQDDDTFTFDYSATTASPSPIHNNNAIVGDSNSPNSAPTRRPTPVPTVKPTEKPIELSFGNINTDASGVSATPRPTPKPPTVPTSSPLQLQLTVRDAPITDVYTDDDTPQTATTNNGDDIVADDANFAYD